MHFKPLPLDGAFLILPERKEDERGFFQRGYCQKAFRKQGIESPLVQVNSSLSLKEGTLRGMHYQLPPKAEDKLVRCIGGTLYDVLLDLRPQSKTFGKWHGEVLSKTNGHMLWVPKGFAHGFLTLEDHTEILYCVTEFYDKESERGIRWNDPSFQITWPKTPTVLSERDQAHPDFDPSYHLGETRS